VFGQHEANHGTTRYRVDSGGPVHVPPEAVASLISKGGFALPKTSAAGTAPARSITAAADELVRLHHDDAGGCSYAGQSYPSDENGDVLVPATAAAALIAHGFVPVPEASRNPAEQGEKPAAAPVLGAAAQSAPRPARR
jgi:hypothetical protein